MPANRSANQSIQITQKYLNTASYAGDPTPGAVISTAQVSGSIVQPYAGFIGGILTLSTAQAANLSDPVNGPLLFGGDYQYVQFYAASSGTAAQGQIVFWLSQPTGNFQQGNFIVTPDIALLGGGDPQQIAGIALCNTGKGNYWFIQVAGIAEVKFKASPLNVFSPMVEDYVSIDFNTPSANADVIGANATLTPAILKGLIGRAWYRVPVAGQISPVFLGVAGPTYMPS
jgi:hypothetical protein